MCGGCGAETSVIGYEESEQLDVEPAKYFVLVTKREKRACKRCEERGVLAAPLPPRIIEKCSGQRPHRDRHGGQQVCDSPSALPAERDSEARHRTRFEPRDARWLGHAGRRVTYTDRRSDAPRVTRVEPTSKPMKLRWMCRCTMAAARIIRPICGSTATPSGAVVFDFRMGRGREGPKQFLEQFEGILQTDGYAVYDHVGGARSGACRLLGARQERLLRGGAS